MVFHICMLCFDSFVQLRVRQRFNPRAHIHSCQFQTKTRERVEPRRKIVAAMTSKRAALETRSPNGVLVHHFPVQESTAFVF
eukprot:2580190-Pleurochrysis_carterae.AAC.2